MRVTRLIKDAVQLGVLAYDGARWFVGWLRDPEPGEPSHCTVPPEGWSCSRTRGHGGPCAAMPRCTWHKQVGDSATRCIHGHSHLGDHDYEQES